jgi:hypothetical protein
MQWGKVVLGSQMPHAAAEMVTEILDLKFSASRDWEEMEEEEEQEAHVSRPPCACPCRNTVQY